MKMNTINTKLEKLEQDFNQKVSNLVSESTNKNELIVANKMTPLQAHVKNEIQVDVKVLSQLASDLIDENEEISDEEIAIELLKNIAANSKRKTMRKIAAKMVKEKWWSKK